MGWTHTKQSLLLADIKRRCKNSGEPFDLDISDIVVPEFCPAIGLRLDWNAGLRADNLPSMDKVVPALGYIKGNVRMISFRANRLKNNASLVELQGIISYIKTHQPYQ